MTDDECITNKGNSNKLVLTNNTSIERKTNPGYKLKLRRKLKTQQPQEENKEIPKCNKKQTPTHRSELFARTAILMTLYITF